MQFMHCTSVHLLVYTHRLRWHHIAVISAISSVAYVVVVVFVIAVVVVVVVVVVLLSSRFFLLDEPYHFIRQKEITAKRTDEMLFVMKNDKDAWKIIFHILKDMPQQSSPGTKEIILIQERKRLCPIPVIVASVRTIFPAHESVHEGAVPTGAASSTCSRSHRLHL